MSLHVVILAAGQGTRMRSAIPKVLHPVGGVPMVERVVRAARGLDAASVHVVVGPGNGEAIRGALAAHPLRFPVQARQLGTGHAVGAALPDLPGTGRLLVLFADGPLVRSETLRTLIDAVGLDEVGLLTAEFDDPAGFGRILRDPDGAVTGIVEQKDADAAQRAIREINTGIMVLPLEALNRWLPALGSDNAQGEYYLTDVIAMAAGEGVPVRGVPAEDPDEVLGVNDRIQLARAERLLQRRIARELMTGGVTIADPERVDVRGTLVAGRDCFVDVGTVFEGDVRLGEGVRIGPNCLVRDAEIGDGTELHAGTVVDGARVGPGCSVGPFARLRPGTVLDGDVRIGNFVETKKTHLGAGAKANHLAYLGDAVVGSGSNVGAGTITCNYDGYGKHRTVLGTGVFVGSNSTLVAPLTLGDGVFVAAGSTVTEDVRAAGLALGRARQHVVPGWVHPALRDDEGDASGAGGA